MVYIMKKTLQNELRNPDKRETLEQTQTITFYTAIFAVNKRLTKKVAGIVKIPRGSDLWFKSLSHQE